MLQKSLYPNYTACMCLPVLDGLLLIETVCSYGGWHSTEGNASVPDVESPNAKQGVCPVHGSEHITEY